MLKNDLRIQKRRRRKTETVKAMNYANSQLFLSLFFFIAISLFYEASFGASVQQTDPNIEEIQNGNGFGRRVLLSFKENPSGSNVTFECSPSGPCVPCIYSEKGDDKYRCSETGYRIPFKCIETKDSMKDTKKTKAKKGRSSMEISDSIEKSHKVSHVDVDFTTPQSHRILLDDSSASDNKSQTYITYRSCIPPETDEKLSVLGFEGVVMFLLLISGLVIYLRKKKAASVSGYVGVRNQTSSRF